MGSKHTSLIALIVAVFFAGVYLRGERARKQEIQLELDALRTRQTEINSVLDDIRRVTARKDSLFRARIDSARVDIEFLKRDEKLARVRIDSLGREIALLQEDIVRNIAAIREAGAFQIAEVSIHSVSIDPDITPEDSLLFNPHEIHVGDSLMAVPETRPVASLVHLDTARTYLGVVERPKDSNRGQEVEMFLAAVNLKPTKDRFGDWRSYPYCAAFVSYALRQAGAIEEPKVRSARALDFVTHKSIEARIVQRGTVKIDPGTIVVWKAKRDPSDPTGHVGFVVDWEGQAGTTIEGNTGPGDAGDQRDGGGVYLRKRLLSPGSAFRITHFTPVIYAP
ncbi:MAG: CHAP domain-containing protein [Rhodothermales bacterium]|nr:CHAP domain-containing protein [Rhodothermales bacterium]